MQKIKITDNISEMTEIGKEIVASKPELYTEPLKKVIKRGCEKIYRIYKDVSPNDMFYKSIYDYWVYGSIIDEELYFGFYNKPHSEKSNYFPQKTG